MKNNLKQKFLRYSIYILAVVLPVQNILAQVVTYRLNLPEFLLFWKEVLVGVMMIIFLYDIFGFLSKNREKLKSKITLYEVIKKVWPLLVLVIISTWSLVTSFIVNDITPKMFFYGFRFELWWVWFFGILVTWVLTNRKKVEEIFNKKFLQGFRNSIYIGFVLVALVSFSSLVFGQDNVLELFGFGKESAGLVVSSPECHAVDFGSDACRLSGGFSSPNHFAGYLLLVLPVFVVSVLNRCHREEQSDVAIPKELSRNEKKVPGGLFEILKRVQDDRRLGFYFNFFAIILTVLFVYLTVSRFAWLGLSVFVGVSLILLGYKFAGKFFAPDKGRWSQTRGVWGWIAKRDGVVFNSSKLKIKNAKFETLFKVLLIFTFLIPMLVGVVVINLSEKTIRELDLPESIIKPSSTVEHSRQTRSAVQILEKHPDKFWLGYGISASGPVAKVEYNEDLLETPIIAENKEISNQNFIVHERLPIPENWYLQLVLNGGVVYAGLYGVVLLYAVKGLGGEVLNFGYSPLIRGGGEAGRVGVIPDSDPESRAEQNDGIPVFTGMTTLVQDGKKHYNPINLINIYFGIGFFAVLLGNLFLHIFENQTIAIYWSLIWLYQHISLPRLLGEGRGEVN